MKEYRDNSVVLNFGYSDYARYAPGVDMREEGENIITIPIRGPFHEQNFSYAPSEFEQKIPTLGYLEDCLAVNIFPTLEKFPKLPNGFCYIVWIKERGEWILIRHYHSTEGSSQWNDEDYYGPFELDDWCEKKLMEAYGIELYLKSAKNMPPAELLLETIKQAQAKGTSELDLSKKQILMLPPDIGAIKTLTELDLSDNHITVLPSEIWDLTNLEKLNISKNQLTILPQDIGRLINLVEFNSSNNALTSFSSEVCQLHNLTELNISNCQLTELPQGIGQLTNLTKLNLSNNALTTFPLEFFQLRNLTELNLSNNQLIVLPQEFSQLSNLVEFYVEDNQLKEPPPEIINQGIDAIREYLTSLEKGEKRILNEVKLLIVGDGRVGKTSLSKRLLGNKFDVNEPQTHGLNIENWITFHKGQEIKAHVWDFGGQEIMHTTHQFFLSKRSLYILVVDDVGVQKLDYWLNYIKVFGGDSPIIVVINKIDKNPMLDVNRRSLIERHKSIKGFFRVSCSTGEGIHAFIDNLTEQITNVELLRASWALSWFNVKAHLEETTKPFISYQEYCNICENEGLSEESTQDVLVEYLNDLGVILHFHDYRLLDTYILDPRWVTNAVYKIINSNELAENNGVLKLRHLGTIFKCPDNTAYKYPREMYRFIIDLMMKFELCYELAPNTILIPDLLDVQEPRFDFDYSNALHFLIEYNFLPTSIIFRFIVKMHRDIKNDLRWRTGVVLADSNSLTTAIIKVDNRDRKIRIAVQGEHKRDYFAIIRRTLKDINESFEQLMFDEKVPLPDHPQIEIEYEELLGLERMKKRGITIGKLGKEYSVKQLLDGIESKEERTKCVLADEGRTVVHFHNRVDKVTTILKEGDNMSKNTTITTGNIHVEKGNLVVAESITESFNKIEASNSSEALKKLLQTLTTDVDKMMKQLPKEKAEAVADDLEKFTDEATKEKPKRKWWELSAKGLKDAAEAVGTVGVSVMTSIEKIIPILEKIS